MRVVYNVQSARHNRLGKLGNSCGTCGYRRVSDGCASPGSSTQPSRFRRRVRAASYTGPNQGGDRGTCGRRSPRDCRSAHPIVMGERNALAFIGRVNQIVWEPRFSSRLIQIMITECPDSRKGRKHLYESALQRPSAELAKLGICLPASGRAARIRSLHSVRTRLVEISVPMWLFRRH